MCNTIVSKLLKRVQFPNVALSIFLQANVLRKGLNEGNPYGIIANMLVCSIIVSKLVSSVQIPNVALSISLQANVLWKGLNEGNPYGIVANMLVCDIIISKLELQLYHNVYFWSHVIGKGMNHQIPSKYVCLFGFYGILTFECYLMPNPFLYK